MTETIATPELSRFLEVFRDSRLLSDGQFDRVVAKLPPDATDARRAASALMEQGVLTKFQADRLLNGRADGFLLGPYVIQEPIGKGTLARVYKAKHRTMNRFVAIKVLDPAKVSDPADREAVQAEARAAARLSHPNVVTVLDINQVNDRLYFVLEYVDGATAEATVKKGGPVPVARACDLVRQAALGLAHAHEKGLAHGAVTPSNLMIGRTSGKADKPQAKLLNAGQARLRQVIGPVTELTAYRFPDAEATPAGDMFGLGATLYYLLTGRAPVPYHKRAANPDPLPIEHVRPETPFQVIELVTRLMAADPAGRPPAAEVAAVLEPHGEYTGGAAIDFDVPPSPVHTLGSVNSLLSGLVGVPVRPVEETPWAGIEDQSAVATLDAEVVATPVQTPAPRSTTPPLPPAPTPDPVAVAPVKPDTRPSAAERALPYAIAAGVLLCTVVAIGAVVKFALK